LFTTTPVELMFKPPVALCIGQREAKTGCMARTCVFSGLQRHIYRETA
jgi:hypothetical protein